MTVVWSKTEAGRQEIQARSKVPGRAQRTLLLLIDGRRSDAQLLAAVQGTSAADFGRLAGLGLIAAPQAGAAQPPMAAFLRTAAGVPVPATPSARPAPPTSYADFTRTLTELIARELGLRGLGLTLAVEKAATSEELMAVADRVIAAVRDRKGPVPADAARRALYGDG